MPITSRTATVAEQAASQTITGTIPDGTVAGDVMVATYGGTSTTGTLSSPAGWTLLASPVTVATDRMLAAYYKKAVGADTAPTFSTTTAASRHTVLMQSYIGVHQTTPIDVAEVFGTSAGPTVVAPSDTTVTAGALLLSAVTVDSSAGDWQIPPGMNLVARNAGGTGRGHALAEEYRGTAGATGSRTWTFSSALAMVAFNVALKPATPGVPGDLSSSTSARMR